MNDLLELIIKKQVNVLLVATLTDYEKYNVYIRIYEEYEGRALTKQEFRKIKKAVKEYDKQNRN